MEDRITSRELKARKDCYVIDVREADGYEAGHIEGAVNIPSGRLVRDEGSGIVPRDREIVVHCRPGIRDGIAYCSLRAVATPT